MQTQYLKWQGGVKMYGRGLKKVIHVTSTFLHLPCSNKKIITFNRSAPLSLIPDHAICPRSTNIPVSVLLSVHSCLITLIQFLQTPIPNDEQYVSCPVRNIMQITTLNQTYQILKCAIDGLYCRFFNISQPEKHMCSQ